MLNPNEIDPKHIVGMQTALLKNRSALDEHRVAKLYKMAKALFLSSECATDTQVQFGRLTSVGGTIVATCTDVETGLFVQISGNMNQGISLAMLTFGKKYCQEFTDTMRHNIGTKIW